MDYELDTFGCRQAHLKHPPGLIGTDQHRKLVELKDSDWVSIRVKHVVVGDPVPSSTCQNDGIHLDQYILTRLGRSSRSPAVALSFAISLRACPPVSATPSPTAPRT